MKGFRTTGISRPALVLGLVAGGLGWSPSAWSQAGGGTGGPSKAGVADVRAASQSGDAELPASSDEQPVDVVVTGFRKSLADALNIKRDNSGIVDAISAEDIGKSTDQNIAEAMQRVTGVSIDRSDGEGTTVTIRGAGPNLNNVKLNGITLTSSDFNQAVDFSQFSSDILSSIKINKTASAEQDEGSLGGNIELESFKPLNVKRDRRIVEVQGRYNDFAENRGQYLEDYGDYRLNLSLSQKLFNDTLGVSLVATREKNSLRRDTYNATWFIPTTYASGATNIETGQVITGYDYNGDGKVAAGPGTDNSELLRAREVRQNTYSYYRNSRDRDSLTGTIQWRPTPTTEVFLDATYSKQEVVYDESRVEVLPQPANNDPKTIFFDPKTLTFVEDVFQQKYSATNTGNLRLPATIRLFRNEASNPSENLILGGGIKQSFGNLNLRLRGGRSLSSSDTDYDLIGRAFVPRTANLSYDPGTVITSAAAAANATFYKSGFSCRPDPRICRTVLNPGLMDDPTKLQPQTLDLTDVSVRDESYSAYFDADWAVGLGPIVRLSAGAKWEDRTKRNQQSSQQLNNASFGNLLTTLTLAPFVEGKTPAWGEKLGFPRDDITDGWVLWDLGKTLDFLKNRTGQALPEVTLNLRGTRQIRQEVYAGYLKADFELFDRAVFGNFGVRYARTQVEAEGYSGLTYYATQLITPENILYYGSQQAAIAALGLSVRATSTSTAANVNTPPLPTFATNEYSDWLPSVNLNWGVHRNLLARFAFSKTIARPAIDSLNPSFTISELPYAENSNASFGGTSLRPYRSTNFDLSMEWYFARNSLLSIAIYNKQLSDFAENATFTAYYRDLRSEYFTQDPTNPLYQILKPASQINFQASPSTVLLPASGGASQAGCMPNREPDLRAPFDDPPAGVLTKCDSVVVVQARNGQGGYVRGVEAQFQHNFTWLPGILGGLGVAANLTYADSRTDEEKVYDANGNVTQFFPALPLAGTSRYTYNATLFYERAGKLLRLAYNNRSDYLVTRNARDGNAFWTEGYATLDVSGSWAITRNVTLNFQAQNLLDTVTRVYATNVIDSVLPTEPSALSGATKDRTVSLQNTGRIYRVGLRFNF